MSEITVAVEGSIHGGQIWVSAVTLLDCAYALMRDGGEFDAAEVITEIVEQAALAAGVHLG